MTARLIPIAAHVRRAPGRSPAFLATTEKLRREVNDRQTLDHMTEMLNRAIEMDVEEFGEDGRG
jgi:hypothetical protein